MRNSNQTHNIFLGEGLNKHVGKDSSGMRECMDEKDLETKKKN